ncbi:RNA polymerase sigma factor [Mangrovibacterium marinum]|uniref:RNA polymerase sigma-70 factor (ECF subfamily) n=1 Tax=Mangrovibacterium marinum TaxID=1639118 RepID=A0A2T5C2K6_9BACT|nr:RNA polymerase sigma factor [Mangrovibacterium marinum]PTN08955.1 RNA polymerase sigma-70 factor (ECF subfamily) [Mangrovibacterium marinum]
MTVEEYNQAVNQHADAVFRFVLKNIRDQEKARDIVQDSFEKLWLHRKSVSAEKVKAYLFSTAYHRLIDWVRKDSRLSIVDEIRSDEACFEHYSDLQEVLNKAIELLPNDQRSVLLLRDYEGYSYKEIAAITKLNESQVKVYIYRARVFLKNYIGKMDVLV